MDEYRRNWMRQMLARDNRMVDAALIGNLLRSISFFASTSIFIVLGLFTLLKYRDEATDILNKIPYAVPASPVLWEAKIFLLAIVFIYAFFKFTWSQRCSIIMRAYWWALRLRPTNASEHFEEYAQSAAGLGRQNAAQAFQTWRCALIILPRGAHLVRQSLPLHGGNDLDNHRPLPPRISFAGIGLFE